MIINKLEELIKQNKQLFIVTIIYLISLFLINPIGEYAVGDDLYFKHQIDAYKEGVFTKSALIDPTFIGQGLFGYLWSLLFGTSYTSLRFLTIIFSLLSLYVLNDIFKFLKFEKYQKLLGLSIFIFNPISFYLALSFNTEIYFLLFSLLTIKFLLLYSQEFKYKYLIYCVIFTILSFSIRQYGVIFLIVTSYLILKYQKLNLKTAGLLTISLFFMVSLLVLPKFTNPEHIESRDYLSLLSFENTFNKIKDIYELAPYIGLFLIPISLNIFAKFSNKIKLLVTIITVFLSIFYLFSNVFSIGNILYIEGLGAKSYTELNLTIFNNILFKIFVSFTCLLSFVTLVFFFLTNKLIIKQNNIKNIFLLIIVLSYLVSIISTKEFDRYYLNFLVFISIFYLIFIQEINFNKYILYISLGLFIAISFIYNYEITTNTRIKWEQGNKLLELKSYKINEIYLSLNFTKYNTFVKNKDFSGQDSKIKIINDDLKCYVQNRISGEYNFIGEGISKITAKAKQLLNLENPVIEDFGFTHSQKGRFNNNSSLIGEVYYQDFSYFAIGRKTSVITFCNK